MKFTFFKKRKPKPQPEFKLFHCGFLREGDERQLSKEQLLDWAFVRVEYNRLIEAEQEKNKNHKLLKI
ncbi:MAG: hypothetical protein ABI855_01455 [Bacteroidota bacterium]